MLSVDLHVVLSHSVLHSLKCQLALMPFAVFSFNSWASDVTDNTMNKITGKERST